MFAYIHTYIHTYIYIYLHKYIYIYRYRYVNKCLYIYMYIHICKYMSPHVLPQIHRASRQCRRRREMQLCNSAQKRPSDLSSSKRSVFHVFKRLTQRLNDFVEFISACQCTSLAGFDVENPLTKKPTFGAKRSETW